MGKWKGSEEHVGWKILLQLPLKNTICCKHQLKAGNIRLDKIALCYLHAQKDTEKLQVKGQEKIHHAKH